MEATDQDLRQPHQASPFLHVLGSQGRSDDETIDLRYLFWVWMKWSWLMVIGALVGAYFGYQQLQSFTPQALAQMTVLPVAAQAQSNLPTGLGAAAAQFGINFGMQPGSVSPFDRFKLTLGSIELAAILQQKYGLLQRIAPTGWDAETGTWKRPSGEEFERQQRINAFLRRNQWSPPNLETLAQYVSSSLRIEPARTAGFQQISVQHTDPDYALWLLDTVFREADELLRAKERQASAERRAFVEKQIESRTMLYLQEALRNLLAQEINKEMTFEANVGYAATVVEAPHALNRRTEPNLPLLFGLPILGWGAAAFVLVTLVAVVRGER